MMSDSEFKFGESEAAERSEPGPGNDSDHSSSLRVTGSPAGPVPLVADTRCHSVCNLKLRHLDNP
jgi:hypothetical protein